MTASQQNLQTALAQSRVTRLAALTPVHRAFHWLHLHQPQIRLWHMEMLRIPAPPFAERARADWFLDRFSALGLVNVHLDQEGNALGELPFTPTDQAEPTSAGRPPPSFLLLSAHLDTVFSAEASAAPREEGDRILCPGACDNAAGLSALLALAAALRFSGISLPTPILFAANVGEEGEGNLRGMRYLFEQGPYRHRIGAALVLEGAGSSSAVTRAVGSQRFRVTINGPGGHSWANSATPNPIVLLARALTALHDLFPLSETQSKTTLSPGVISGGTSINSIPSSASVLLDLRSTDASELVRHQRGIHDAFNTVVAQANLRSSASAPTQLQIDAIGSRPAAALPDDSPLLHTLRAVDRHLGLRTDLRLASTDANLPLSLGIPAVALAAGGTGGGIHTLAEWYDPTGREVALRRILLTLLDLAQTLAQTLGSPLGPSPSQS